MISNLDVLEVGSILFVRGTTVLSWLIRKVLRSEYSHVAVYVGGDTVVEADWDGVITSHINKYKDDPKYFVELVTPPLTLPQMNTFVESVALFVGDKYDYSLLLGNVFSRMIHRARRKMGLWNTPREWICSELVARGLRRAGMNLGLPDSQVTPKDLYIKLKGAGRD